MSYRHSLVGWATQVDCRKRDTTLMGSIIRLAKTFKYNSFNEVDDDELSEADVHHQKDQFVIAAIEKERYSHLCWACNSKKALNHLLQMYINENKDSRVYIEFIPREFAETVQSIGFKEHSEYIEFWITDLNSATDVVGSPDIRIREYLPADLAQISRITYQCEKQSRGFTTETVDSLREWVSNPESSIVVATARDEVVGHILMSIYAFNSRKGAVLWIRELAVIPHAQRRGIGRQLLTYVINEGVARGAKRSFLACDRENISAIHLYKSLGYKSIDGQGQINMIYERCS